MKTRDLTETIDRSTFDKIMSVARAYDIDKGGHFDARMGAINFWCTDDDKPGVWPGVVGGEQETEFVGTVYFDWCNPASASLKLEAYPLPAKRPGLRDAATRYSTCPFSDAYLESCLDWVAAKWAELCRLADLHPNIVGVKCPFCDLCWKGKLLNGLLEHISECHEKVEKLVLGDPTVIETATGVYQIENMETFQ